jgi:glycosyltransferase involved in cell wall biosynthesis
MNINKTHISVCICTYKRPDYLARLLGDLARQETEGLFTYSVVVADNDAARSAELVASQFATASSIAIRYCVQPVRSVPLTRNVCIENVTGNYVAMIDDDEFPDPRWMLTLFKALHRFGADGVLGPVMPYFDQKAPKWIIKGKFWERASYPTGLVIDWRKGRTGSVLLKRSIFASGEPPFRPQFQGGGADQDFFRRMIEKGHVFVWCNEAVAYELVPPVRWKRSFLLRRALLRGWATRAHPTSGTKELVTSIVAVPAYILASPIALALGQHRFMALMVSLFHHLGRLCASAKIRPIKQAYLTE